MSQSAFNWCFIGAGRLAAAVAGEIITSGRHKVLSVYTRRNEQCRSFANRFGAKPCASAEEAISISGVDGVYVVTPHSSHCEYIRLALDIGIPVLCEKPFTVNSMEAEEVLRLAREKGIYTAEAMWTWFGPVAHQVKKWLDKGEFGDVQEVKANYHMNIRHFSPRLTDPCRAGGALLDVGIYPVTYLYRLFGNPESVRCKGVLDQGIDLREDIEMTFAENRTYMASSSIVDFSGFERLKIRGDKSSVSIPFFHNASKVKLRRRDGSHEIFRGDGGYLNEFDCVAAEIREGIPESRFVPHESTLDVMKILDQCRQQMGLSYPFE